MPSSFVRTRKLPGESSRSVKTYPKIERMIETSTKSNKDVFCVCYSKLMNGFNVVMKTALCGAMLIV